MSTPEHVNPFPGQVLRQVFNWGDSSSEATVEEKRPMVADIEDADLVTSEVEGKEGRHKLVLDIDFPAKLLPSSTPGHFHLFIDKEMSWEAYQEVLEVLADAGIIEYGYRGASEERGFTGVRVPWKKKSNVEDPRCARCHKTPDQIMEYQLAAADGGVTPVQFVIDNEGTYNTENGRFWCTECYLAIGQPLGVAW